MVPPRAFKGGESEAGCKSEAASLGRPNDALDGRPEQGCPAQSRLFNLAVGRM